MSVQKYVVTQEESGFTILKNNVLQNLTDVEALGLWVYLASLPTNWTFYKEQLKDHFKIGRERLNRLLQTLANHKLIRIENTRDDKGRFVQMSLTVCNGSEFAQNNKSPKPTPVLDERPNCTPCTGNPLTGIQSLDTDNYKDISKKKENTKEKSINNSANDFAQENISNGFDEFWNIIPTRKNKVRAKRIWEKKNLYKIAALICDDVSNRLLNDNQWQDKQYIPHPSTYLANELWNDEIIQITKKPIAKGSKSTDSLSRVMGKYLNQGVTYDQHGNTHDPLR